MNLVLGLTLWMVTALAAAAQPSDSCDGSQNLTGLDTIPHSMGQTASTNALDMSASTCSEQGLDHVTCFVPENSCTLQLSCGAIRRGLQVAINIYDLETAVPRNTPQAGPGACTTAPAGCIASNSGTGAGSLSGVSLTGGVEYCVVCEAGGGTPLFLQLEMSGSSTCGALPVTLQGFSIDEPDAAR